LLITEPQTRLFFALENRIIAKVTKVQHRRATFVWTFPMQRIELETLINAPIESCFDAARDIGLHVRLATRTRERAIAGRVKGLIGPSEWVTFSAIHFGLRLQLTAHITQFDPPHLFADEQTRGPFAFLRHTHIFESLGPEQTLMRDVVEFTAPLGILGRLAEPVVAWHLSRFLCERAQRLKLVLE
jgi:ligand-binding SRPBCC domain-containing protein